MRIFLAASLLLLTALAGCADSSGSTPVDEHDQKFGDLRVKDGLGAIRGIVLDETITPIMGATVQIQGGDSAETNEDGAFVFVDLEPGTYFLEATKLGYKAAQASAPVEAGNAAPDIIKIQLAGDPESRPDVQYMSYEGLLQCSFTAVVGFNACGLAADVGSLDLGESQVRYPLSRQPTWIQTEMVWDSTQPLGDGLELMYSYGDCGSGFYCDHATAGPSPLILSANETMSATLLEEEGELYIRVFGSETNAVPGSGVGTTLDQSFTHYTSIFYGFKPDEGWSFVRDGPHPLPS